jgi:hypothetical protein
VQISRILYPFPRGSRRVMARWHAEWSVAKRRVPPRATARTALSFWTEPILREQPPASCAASNCEQPEPDMCPGETAATDAQWGDRAFERQYRDRMGLRWLVCV